MKTFIKLSLVVAIMFFSTSIKAQTFGNVQNSIPRDKDGINQFDVKKDSAQFPLPDSTLIFFVSDK